MGFNSGFVTIIGKPNVGKSTLINQIINAKVAITTPKPQTTRNLIRGIYNDDDSQIVFIDTPGIHKPKELIGREMVREALETVDNVDLIYFLIDATKGFNRNDHLVFNRIKDININKFLLINKVDLINKSELLQLLNKIDTSLFDEIIPISAKKNTNIEELIKVTKKYLNNDELFFDKDQYIDKSEKFMISEIIREKVMLVTNQEVPHSTACMIDKIEFKKESVYIIATILVERDSQKGIVIGKNGSKLKQIGSKARVDIEDLLNKKVYLELFVRVEEKWRNRLNKLRELGIGNSENFNE